MSMEAIKKILRRNGNKETAHLRSLSTSFSFVVRLSYDRFSVYIEDSESVTRKEIKKWSETNRKIYKLIVA